MRLGHKKTRTAHVLSSYQWPHVGKLNPRNRKEQLYSHSSRQYRRPDALLRVNWSKCKVYWPLETKYTIIGYSRWGKSWVRIVCWDVLHVHICLYIYTRGACKNSNRTVARKIDLQQHTVDPECNQMQSGFKKKDQSRIYRLKKKGTTMAIQSAQGKVNCT